MNNNYLFYFILIPVFLGIIIYNIFFSKAAIIKRKLRKTAEKKISDFQTGEVAKTIGAIKYVGDTLNAPLSARKCAYYHVLVEKRVSSGKSSHWETIIEEEIAAHVVITEGRDYALIETEMVKSYLIDDKQYSSGFLNDATETLKLYLDRHGYDAVNWLGLNNSIRYKEGILEEGELVAVAGKGTWKRKEEVKLDIPVERILVIGPHDSEPVYFSDDSDVTKEVENPIV